MADASSLALTAVLAPFLQSDEQHFSHIHQAVTYTWCMLPGWASALLLNLTQLFSFPMLTVTTSMIVTLFSRCSKHI